MPFFFRGTGRVVKVFKERVGSENCVLSRFNQLELLQDAKDEKEWELLADYLSTPYYLKASEDTWQALDFAQYLCHNPSALGFSSPLNSINLIN